MKTWAIAVGVLIVLFCVSYLVRHPSTVVQTFAKLFTTQRGKNLVKNPGWCARTAAVRRAARFLVPGCSVQSCSCWVARWVHSNASPKPRR
jgi:hypothetical protein